MNTTPDQGTGRVAVITGASSGIGAATARALAASGFRLALLARRAGRIQAVSAASAAATRGPPVRVLWPVWLPGFS